MDEKTTDTLNSGRQAVIAFDLFKPFLDKERDNILAKIKSEFRSNKHDLSVYLGLVSTLVSLDDLESKILKTINKGSVIAEKVVVK